MEAVTLMRFTKTNAAILFAGTLLLVIAGRMAGESFKSIGTRHKLSKQRIHMLTVEAIEQMQRSMVG